MPIYEYRCRSCGAEYEDLVRLGTRDEEVECPECGELQSERKVSVFATTGSSGTTSGSSCGPSGFG